MRQLGYAAILAQLGYLAGWALKQIHEQDWRVLAAWLLAMGAMAALVIVLDRSSKKREV